MNPCYYTVDQFHRPKLSSQTTRMEGKKNE